VVQDKKPVEDYCKQRKKTFSFRTEREHLGHLSCSVALTCLHSATFTGLHCLNWDPKGDLCLKREHENDV
jgi:hypothetical protein